MSGQKQMSKTLSARERKQLYIKVCQHPRFDSLPGKYKQILACLAVGMTFAEIGKDYGVRFGTVWVWRNKAFKILGLYVTEEVEKVIKVKIKRPMLPEEIMQQVDIWKGEIWVQK